MIISVYVKYLFILAAYYFIVKVNSMTSYLCVCLLFIEVYIHSYLMLLARYIYMFISCQWIDFFFFVVLSLYCLKKFKTRKKKGKVFLEYTDRSSILFFLFLSSCVFSHLLLRFFLLSFDEKKKQAIFFSLLFLLG